MSNTINQPIPDPPMAKKKENTVMRYIKGTAAVFTVIAMILSGYIYIDKTYAKDVKIKMIEWRLDMKIEGDKQTNLRNQIWAIEDACKVDTKSYQCNSDRLRELQSDKNTVDQRMDSLIKKEVKS